MRALIIDDTKISRLIVDGILKGIGVETHQATNGGEALQILEKEGVFDFVLLDWNMPEMNGLQFVNYVRQNSAYDSMKIIMLTVESHLVDMSQVLDAGADEYIIKPVRESVVLEKLALVGVTV
jgi:two-component system chemotaxis response regulator CheY